MGGKGGRGDGRGASLLGGMTRAEQAILMEHGKMAGRGGGKSERGEVGEGAGRGRDGGYARVDRERERERLKAAQAVAEKRLKEQDKHTCIKEREDKAKSAAEKELERLDGLGGGKNKAAGRGRGGGAGAGMQPRGTIFGRSRVGPNASVPRYAYAQDESGDGDGGDGEGDGAGESSECGGCGDVGPCDAHGLCRGCGGWVGRAVASAADASRVAKKKGGVVGVGGGSSRAAKGIVDRRYSASVRHRAPCCRMLGPPCTCTHCRHSPGSLCCISRGSNTTRMIPFRNQSLHPTVPRWSDLRS